MGQRLTGAEKAIATAPASKGSTRNYGNRLHTRQSGGGCDHPFERLPRKGGIVIARIGETDTPDNDVGSIKARIQMRYQQSTADQQAGASHQNQSERNFSDYEETTDAVAAAPA